MDYFLMRLGMSHPDLWMMWAAIILSAVNSVGLVMLRHSVLDSRNGWDTWIVLTPSGDVIGFTDGDCD